MKETEIKIRIDSETKTKFRNKCSLEKITMSDKINKFINEDVSNLVSPINLELEKPIRIVLVKLILNKILNDCLFEYDENLKTTLDENFKKNLGFEVFVSDIKVTEEYNITYGNVIFKLEDDTPICIDFNVCNSGN
jgi:antitoxin component of RelBE/YafQ-DinJ toxin-antitoxin module